MTIFRLKNIVAALKANRQKLSQKNLRTDSEAQTNQPINLQVLNSRVLLKPSQKQESRTDTFVVEICGTFHTPDNQHNICAEIVIEDITQGQNIITPIWPSDNKWKRQDSPGFYYQVDLGKLPQKDMLLSNWMCVVQIKADCFLLEEKGLRKLRFQTTLFSNNTKEEIAASTYILTYENPALGYLNLKQNIERAKTLAVTLGFAACAVDNRFCNSEIDVIKTWAKQNIDTACSSKKTQKKLEKALNKTVKFFRQGNQLNIQRICEDIVGLAPLANRYQFLDLYLHATQADDSASEQKFELLKKLTIWLGLDMERFRAMMEKILPANKFNITDQELILGVTSQMSMEKIFRQLNHEYRKWNARVTNSNLEIQSQADHMLNLIAEERSKYIIQA